MSLQRAVLVAELEEMHGRSFVELAGTPDESWAVQRLGDVARSVLGREAIVWERSAGIAALVVGNPADLDGLLTSAAHLRELAQSRLASVELSIGLGRIYGDPLELKESYNEAVRALGAVRGTGGKGQIASFAQLGLERLLLSCSEMELRAFVETTLGPLLRYEKEHPAANLLNTLRAYLEHNRTISGTAQAMYVHYNTVRYRLERLQGILGPFVDGPDQCLRLELALRVQSLLATVR
jgi:purine catabolism regulator